MQAFFTDYTHNAPPIPQARRPKYPWPHTDSAFCHSNLQALTTPSRSALSRLRARPHTRLDLSDQRNWCASCVQVGFDKKKRLVFYASLCFYYKYWCPPRESNTAPTDYESAALTKHELEGLRSLYHQTLTTNLIVGDNVCFYCPSRKLLSLSARLGWRSLRKAFASI